MPDATTPSLERWRLILGGNEADGLGCHLNDHQAALDKCLSELYEKPEGSGGTPSKGKKRGGLGSSSPRIQRWLGDIRTFFPKGVVQVMQNDALNRLGLKEMLMQPEILESVEADVGLVSTLISLNRVIPAKTRETARMVVRKVVADLEKRLAAKTRQSVRGALDRSTRNQRPRLHEIDWNRTIKSNLKNYLPEEGTLIPEVRIGHGRKTRTVVKDIILVIDQSGSMAESVIYSSVFAAILASLNKARTRIIFFDTSVVDMTEKVEDPIEILFGVQLGGGTDIHKALTYAAGKVTRPQDTVMILISDLIEGGSLAGMFQCAQRLIESGVVLVSLLALNDSGVPCYDAHNAAMMCSLGSPAFGCTPDLFADLMAAAILKKDLYAWADRNSISVKSDGTLR